MCKCKSVNRFGPYKIILPFLLKQRVNCTFLLRVLEKKKKKKEKTQNSGLSPGLCCVPVKLSPIFNSLRLKVKTRCEEKGRKKKKKRKRRSREKMLKGKQSKEKKKKDEE